MPESKTCIVFATEKPHNKEEKYNERIELYAFDEHFIEVRDDKQLPPVTYPSSFITIKDSSLIVDRPLCSLEHCHAYASFTSLKNHVYRAGGVYYRCRECYAHARRIESYPVGSEAAKFVDCWDSVNNIWTALPPLNVGRDRCHLLVMKEKLYAVGGQTKTSGGKLDFIEVYEESKQQWKSYHCPESVNLNCERFVCASVEEKGYILLGSESDDRFYAFSPIGDDDGSWKRMENLKCEEMLIFQCRDYPAVVEGSRLLWFKMPLGSVLVGLDIDRGEYFEINLAPVGVPTLTSKIELLYDAGSKEFAVVWRDNCIYVLEGERESKHFDSVQGIAGTHCCRIKIDFEKARVREKCYELVSHKRCIGPKWIHTLGAAFLAEVGVAVRNASNSNTVGRGPKRMRT